MSYIKNQAIYKRAQVNSRDSFGKNLVRCTFCVATRENVSRYIPLWLNYASNIWFGVVAQ